MTQESLELNNDMTAEFAATFLTRDAAIQQLELISTLVRHWSTESLVSCKVTIERYKPGRIVKS